MEPRIETIGEKKLVGKRVKMSLANDRTIELWQSFMPARKFIENVLSPDLFCLQLFDNTLDFKSFNEHTAFEKLACAEVSASAAIPAGMEAYTLSGGLYAVFTHIGAASSGPRTFQYIFTTWLPRSDYVLDTRPHFELLGSKYKNNEADSEEEIWIPIKRR